MNKEDFLMKQIDEFREKAKDLQTKLTAREEELERLEGDVNVMETKVKVRREEADEIISKTKEQIKDMSTKVETKLGELSSILEEKLKADDSLTSDRNQEIIIEIEALSKQLDELKNDVNDKVHSENVKCYRNVQSVLDELKEDLEKKEISDQKVAKIAAPAKAALFFGILNTILLIGYILYDSGLIWMFM